MISDNWMITVDESVYTKANDYFNKLNHTEFNPVKGIITYNKFGKYITYNKFKKPDIELFNIQEFEEISIVQFEKYILGIENTYEELKTIITKLNI